MLRVNRTKQNLTQRIDFVPQTIPDNSAARIAANYEVQVNHDSSNDVLVVLKAKGKRSSSQQNTKLQQTEIPTDIDNYFTPPPKVLYPRHNLVNLLRVIQQEPSRVGLINQGHTCFMDAALQCLFYTTPFYNFVMTTDHPQRCMFYFIAFLPFL